jgi:hypothetical protein
MADLNNFVMKKSYYLCNMKPIRRYGRCLRMILTRTASRMRSSRTRTARTIPRTAQTTTARTVPAATLTTAARTTTKTDQI